MFRQDQEAVVNLMAMVLFGAFALFPPQFQEAAAVRYLNPPPEYIEWFHFGFTESLADSLWLRWIQDNDYCQTYGRTVEILPKDQGELKSSDSLSWLPRHKVCDNSWGFKMLDAITRLAPKFEIPYLAGASSLAILVEDFEGATVLYERGLAQYPKNWQLLYRAAFHYQFNLKDPVTAAQLLVRVADNGGPEWTRSLASRLYSRSGQIELGIVTLEAYKATIRPEFEKAIQEIDERIAHLKSQMIESHKGP